MHRSSVISPQTEDTEAMIWHRLLWLLCQCLFFSHLKSKWNTFTVKTIKETTLLFSELCETEEECNNILYLSFHQLNINIFLVLLFFICIEFASYSHLGQPDGHEIKSSKLFQSMWDIALNVVHRMYNMTMLIDFVSERRLMTAYEIALRD